MGMFSEEDSRREKKTDLDEQGFGVMSKHAQGIKGSVCFMASAAI